MRLNTLMLIAALALSGCATKYGLGSPIDEIVQALGQDKATLVITYPTAAGLARLIRVNAPNARVIIDSSGQVAVQHEGETK